ncbi:hypothetical protein C8R43DRAFT_944834 [Mycena crocata]|nr:hypothetical protein C8R43DRAFT_944834 [Mycena crocata]
MTLIVDHVVDAKQNVLEQKAQVIVTNTYTQPNSAEYILFKPFLLTDIMPPKYEIMRSRSYWADRARRTRAATSTASTSGGANPDLIDPHAPILSDGQVVVTFIPGNPIPQTSILHPNGALIPIPRPGAPSPGSVQPRRRRKAIARPGAHQRPQPSNAKLAREDAELLARLNGPRGTLKRHAPSVAKMISLISDYFQAEDLVRA